MEFILQFEISVIATLQLIILAYPLLSFCNTNNTYEHSLQNQE